MYLTRVFLKRPTLVFVLIALTTLAAVMALRSLVVQQTPNSGLPAISVSVGYSGASTTELVTEVAQPIEDQLAGTPYLDHIDTTIQTGQVNISASFATQSTDTENIANVEKAIQAAERSLPSTIAAPTIRVADPSEPTVIALALISSKYPEAVLASIANNSIVPAIEQLPGISNVNVTGTTQPAFVVIVDPNMLAANNLTLTDVVSSITPNNVRAPGGIVYGPTHETQLDVRGDLPNPQAVANLPIHVAYAGTTVAGATTGGASGVSSTAGSSTGGAAGGSSSGAVTGAPGSAPGAAPRANATVPPARINAPIQSLPSSLSLATMPPLPATGTTGASGTSGGTSTGGTAATGTSGTSTTGAATTGPAATGTSATTGSATSTGGTSTGGTITGGTSGTAASGAGYSSSTSATTTASATTTSTSSIVNSESPTANVPVDPPLTPSTVTSTSASTGSSIAAGALPSTGSSSYGSGAGTSTSGFVGSLQSWAVPSADKRISDVASVLSGTVVQRVFSSQNGKPGVTLLVQKATQASEVTVADEVIKALPALKAQFPNVDFQIAHVQATYTEQQVEGVEHTLIEGIALTAIVMLFFLGSWRNAVVVMIAIPTSLGVTLFVMQMLNLTLDTISLMAMTLVIGILIDDSTVVLENIERHRSLGEAPADAALNGRSEIGMAAIVLTTVDVIVFLPIAFAGGQVGQLLTEFAIVVTVATVTSLFVSFTITPALAGLWSMESKWRPWRPIRWFNGRFEALRSRYAQHWLPAAMRMPWPIVIVAILSCVVAFFLVPTGLVGEEFIPPQNQGIITVQVTYPAGYPVAQTEAAMSRLEAIVKQAIPEKALQYETTVAGAYSAAFGGFVQEGNVGQITVYLQNPQQTTQYTNILQQKLPGAASGALVAVTASTGLGGGAQQPIDELVSTTDGADPTPFARRVFQTLQSTPGATGAQDSATNAAPQMEVDFDRPRLQALDVSDGTAAAAVEASFGGDVASQIETPDRGLTDIEVIYPRSAQTSLDDVLAIPIRAESGGIVRLGDVAHLKYAPAPLLITRENRATVIHVSANVAPGSNLSDVTNAFTKRVRGLHLPKNVLIHPAAQGQQDLMGQALRTLGGSLAISIVLVFLVIVALYNSYRTPFVTLFAIPVAAIGALGALFITRQTLNLYSLIGIILLIGLVTKNGILLVDFADIVRERDHKSREDGMREAAQTRFRPIIMTTVAMVAGMLPLALGLEPGGAQRASLAIVVIGGLLSSLVLTLFIVPIMYSWIAPKELRHGVVFADEHKDDRKDEPPRRGGPAPQPA
jgi:HAE1 family hydrophobic/amphiphilic exporter-1